MYKQALLSVTIACYTLLAVPPLALAEEVSDPLEGVNRVIFSFNDTLDEYVLEPVAKAYRWATPQPIRIGVRNFFENIQYPRYLVSDLLQLKFEQAAIHTGRFVLNTTAGLGGFIDASKLMFDIEHHEEDLGTALGYYGVPSGPYLMLPFLGPSNVRDLFGRAGDRFLDPLTWVALSDELSWEQEAVISGGSSALEVISIRENLIDAVEAGKEASVDYYSFVRKTYAQRRQALIYDGTPPGQDEFGDFEDDEFLDEEE